MKKHVIITSCNESCGDFLVSHWLKSLETEVNLTNIDVVVIDYGLNNEQLAKLGKHSVRIIPKLRAKQVVNLRFVDTAEFLVKNKYDQVLIVDGGDIIFQKDISHLFDQNKDKYRGVVLELDVLFNEVFIPGAFTKQTGRDVYRVVKDKPVINAGFILGSRKKIIKLGDEVERLVINKARYGPDQIVVNYLFHQDGLVLLDYKYNFMIHNTLRKFSISKGVFYYQNERIPVVHNAGRKGFLRPVINFGYGKGHNTLNYPMYYYKRWYYGILKYPKKIISRLMSLD